MEKSVKHKVKIESPAAARKEVSEYIGLSKGQQVNVNVAVEQTAPNRAVSQFARMIEDETLFGKRDTQIVLSEILYVVLERNVSLTDADKLQVQIEATRMATERFPEIG